MFRSIQVSAILAAAVLIAAPGCCSTNGLLCSHSSPSEETVVADYSGGYVENYSTGCSECGCGCGVAADTETFYSGNASPTAAEVVDADKYLIGTPIDQGEVAAPSGDVSPTPAANSAVDGSGSKLLDIVHPPADLKTPIEASLPGNLLP